MQPLQQAALVDAQTMTNIFSSIEVVLNVQKEVLRQLEEKGSEANIGRIFLELVFAHYLSVSFSFGSPLLPLSLSPLSPQLSVSSSLCVCASVCVCVF